MEIAGLTPAENRAYKYAVEAGQSLGYLRSIHSRLAILTMPGVPDSYKVESATATYDRLSEILAEIDPDRRTDYVAA